MRSLPESPRLGGLEDGSVSLVTGPGHSADYGELDVVLPEEVGLGPADVVLLLEHGRPDDRDGVSGGPVVACHFHVQLAHCPVQRHIPVLFVHVVDAGAGLVPEHDSEGFDMIGSPLIDFVDGQDLALCSFGLELPAQVVPEFGFGDDFVVGE